MDKKTKKEGSGPPEDVREELPSAVDDAADVMSDYKKNVVKPVC